jgi:hypothetical protein
MVEATTIFFFFLNHVYVRLGERQENLWGEPLAFSFMNKLIMLEKFKVTFINTGW